MTSFYDQYELLEPLPGSEKWTPLYETTIWTGEQLFTGEPVIVKEIFFVPAEAKDKRRAMAARNQFREEKRTLEFLRDIPQVVRLIDYFEEDDTSYLVLEHIQGQSLAETLRGRALSVTQALPLFIQLAEAVAEIHQRNIIHRDLTPNNVFLGPNDELKVIDFGLAFRQVGVLELGAGTSAYVPPEALRYGARPTRAYDIFSFGVVMYRVLTGKLPFLPGELQQTETVSLSFPEAGIPLVLRQLITQCVQKDPGQRPSSMRGLVHQLRRIAVND